MKLKFFLAAFAAFALLIASPQAHACGCCGNGVLDEGEQCDDGNRVNGDGCSSECEVECGGEGCTPGYWKQPQHFDSWTFYTTGQSFNTVFGGNYFSSSLTLLQALGLNGGGINALARHSVAALLNATNGTVDYPDEETASIIADFQAAVAGGASTIEAQKNTFDSWNNGAGGCPLN